METHDRKIIAQLRAYQKFIGWGPSGKPEYEYPEICQAAADALEARDKMIMELVAAFAYYVDSGNKGWILAGGLDRALSLISQAQSKDKAE